MIASEGSGVERGFVPGAVPSEVSMSSTFFAQGCRYKSWHLLRVTRMSQALRCCSSANAVDEFKSCINTSWEISSASAGERVWLRAMR